MTQAQKIAARYREVLLDGKWVANTNYKEQLSDLSWQEATRKIGDLNTIAALTFHVGYYIDGLARVLEGGPLDIRDKFSYDFDPITNQEEWDQLRNKLYADTERYTALIAQLSDEKLESGFVKEDYGTYRRNLEAILEHSYYHLGQIVLLKKMVKN